MNQFIIYDHKKFNLSDSIKLTDHYSVQLTNKENKKIERGNCSAIIIGDFIGDKNKVFDVDEENIKELKGNFYLILITNNSVKIINSIFSVLPIYYNEDFSLVGSSVDLIRSHQKDECSVDKKFILEVLLFNYGFFNRTLYKDISLLPCNSLIQINETTINIKKHTNVLELLAQQIKASETQVDTIADLFIDTAKHYFPDEPFHIAFTSGFDGRTLVSCATHYNKKFKTFSFGKPENEDIYVPKKNAAELNINYLEFNLGTNDYVKHQFFGAAEEYINFSNGGNGFIYPHFLYTTKEIAKESNYMLSGYVGSELFRALHIPGAVSSRALINLFKNESASSLYNQFAASEALSYLKIELFEKELKELVNEVTVYRNNIPANLSKNQQLYFFVFEEVIRKFFGQWISVQQNYINVRTPFLDYNFIKALLQTKYAGANMDFLTENPYKRMNGQVIYASIIKKTNKIIYKQKTGKGYRPVDILNKLYLPNILLPFAVKRFKRKVTKENLDNLGIISGIKNSRIDISKLKKNQYFNSDAISKSVEQLNSLTPEKERDALLMSLSLLYKYENNSLN